MRAEGAGDLGMCIKVGEQRGSKGCVVKEPLPLYKLKLERGDRKVPPCDLYKEVSV